MTKAQTKDTDSHSEQTEEQTLSFSADVSRLLDIVAHALYSNRDVFLRELISNAADACDRLRYEALSNPALTKESAELKIHVSKDTTTRTVTVLDTGIGMTRDELVDNLGTIAKSGTSAIMEQAAQASSDKDKLSLIGQFGVGFYAGFMASDRIEVLSRKAGESATYHWESDGRTGFSIREATPAESATLKAGHGTAIILHINDDACEFLLDQKLDEVIKTYSDHVSFPIMLGDLSEPMNKASALWTRPKNEITPEQYQEFYHHIGPGMDAPMLTHHWKAEGKIEYNALLFTPTLRPWDLYDPTRKHAVRLYVKRVFISDDCEGLMYPWMRFLRGVIDSEDIPLNISREMLQHNPVIAKIRSGVAKRVLRDLDKLSHDDPITFAAFWGQFGAVLKEGLYDAVEHREALLKVVRFYSTHENKKEKDTSSSDSFGGSISQSCENGKIDYPDKQGNDDKSSDLSQNTDSPLPETSDTLSLPSPLRSVSDYVKSMRDGQDEIYYISGENRETLENSPQLEGFKARGLEVLFFTDTIDDFWLQSISDFEGKAFKSVTQGDIDLSKFDKQLTIDSDKSTEKEENTAPSTENTTATPSAPITALCKIIKDTLADEVGNVRVSNRLTDSPVCLIAATGEVDMNMERVLKIHQQYEPQSKRILEINAHHPLIEKLASLEKGEALDSAAHLLLDQAKIIQGEPIANPTRFAKAMAEFMERGLGQ